GGIVPEGHAAAQRTPMHDLDARNGFLPSATAVNLAISRRTFQTLGGFDETLSPAEDRDLSFRAGLHGLRLTAAPRAVVSVATKSVAQQLACELHRARAHAALRRKYRYFVF